MTRLGYDGYQEDASPCTDCGILYTPNQLCICDCGDYLCAGCHEDRVCCGENAPADCPECGDGAVVTLDEASKLWAVACACCDYSVKGSKHRSVAIDRWDAAAATKARTVALVRMKAPNNSHALARVMADHIVGKIREAEDAGCHTMTFTLPEDICREIWSRFADTFSLEDGEVFGTRRLWAGHLDVQGSARVTLSAEVAP